MKTTVLEAQWNMEAAKPGRRGRARGPRITERDRELLTFLAEHRLALAAHAQALLGISQLAAYARLRALRKAGLLVSAQPFNNHPSCYQVTREGLAAVGSDLREPRPIDLAGYRHDVGVAWLALAARAGVWGELSDVVCERRMRSHDGRLRRSELQDAEPAARYGIRLGGVGPAGRERLHYPDLILVDSGGRRIAVELELTSKGRARRETILGGYAADARVDAILYLVDRKPVGKAVETSARQLGISDLVHVQAVNWGADAPPDAAGRWRHRTSDRRRPDPAAGR